MKILKKNSKSKNVRIKHKNKEKDENQLETIDNRRISKLKVSIVIIICAVIFIYAIYLAAKLVKNPANTFIVTNGNISQEESEVGYIVRRETVVKGKNYKNGMVKIKNEGEKVAKGDSVYRYYSSGEENLKKKIEEINTEIQTVMQNEQGAFSSDIKLLENQIEKELNLVYGMNNIQKIQEHTKNINSYIDKKARISGSKSPAGSYLKQLLDRKEENEKKLNEGSEYIEAPESGIVSYRVDGMEEALKTDNLSNLNKEFLSKLNLKTGQTVASSEEMGKIVDNYESYIIFNSNSNESKEVKVGDSIKVRLQNEYTVKATIENILEESDNSRTIAIKFTQNVEKIISYRKISFDIIWWDAEGFRIPSEAIRMQEDLAYVVRNRNGYYNKMLVKILKQNEEFCIVRQYKTEELKELGFTNTQIYDMKNISLYDEIVLNPTDEQMLR